MRKILVTAISGDIGNGILKILKEQTGMELYGCDINSIAVGMDMVKEFYQCKMAVEQGYIDELLYNCMRWGITDLIPVNEREIEVIDQARELFFEQGINVLIQSAKVLENCLDKIKTARFLQERGIRTPKTYDMYEFDAKAHIGEKYICKPVKSNGSKGIYTLTISENTSVEKTQNMLLQQYIEGEEYTVGVYRNEDITKVIAFKRQLKNGYSNFVELVCDPEIEKLALKVAEAFELSGYVNIQMRKQDGKYYIFEINPRISGTVRFRHMLGFCDVLWWLNRNDEAQKQEMQDWKCNYTKAIGMRELNEKYVILES